MRCSPKLSPVILGLTLAVAGMPVGRSAEKPDSSPGAAVKDASPEAVPARKVKKEKGGQAKGAAKKEPKSGDAAESGSQEKPEKDGKKKNDDEKVSPQLLLPLPTGQDSRGVVIPISDDATGQKSMSFDIGIARRIDEDHVKMTNLVIETFAEGSEEKEMTIELPDSMLNMKTGVITGQERVTIKRNDFELTGQTMEFNTNTKQGKVQGDVKMIIYDLNLENSSSSPESEKTGG
ncbi:MAG: LPS export ABC transporter periplasmic protein LptC [Chthoniobacteraceae bacterium]